MARGFFSGLVIGAAVSGVVLGAVSVKIDVNRHPAPAGATGPEVPAGSHFNQMRDDTAARLPQADGAPEVGATAPQIEAVAPDDLSTLATDDIKATARPAPGEIEKGLSAPQMGDEDSGVSLGKADEEASTLQTGSPTLAVAQPDLEKTSDDPAIFADPAQPNPPEVESGAGFSLKVDDPDTSVPAMTTRGSAGDESGSVSEDRTAPEDPSSNSVWEQNRAMEAYSALFENPDGKPLMSVVLIDDAASAAGPEMLASFPYPVSVAINATAPDARDAMQRYRNAGIEVLVIADLPDRANAGDAHAMMQNIGASVPEAVGVLEGEGAGLQISRDASEALARALLETGQSLVLFRKELQTAPRLIAREGVAVGTILSDFDGDNQSAADIGRQFDQAASEAAQGVEGVILLGHLRGETIDALRRWASQDSASQVSLAPVSAVLKAGDPRAPD